VVIYVFKVQHWSQEPHIVWGSVMRLFIATWLWSLVELNCSSGLASLSLSGYCRVVQKRGHFVLRLITYNLQMSYNLKYTLADVNYGYYELARSKKPLSMQVKVYRCWKYWFGCAMTCVNTASSFVIVVALLLINDDIGRLLWRHNRCPPGPATASATS